MSDEISINNERINSEPLQVTYAELCRICIENTVVREGATYAELIENMNIVQAAKTATDCIILNKKQVNILNTAVMNMRWTVLKPEIITFCEYIKSFTV